MIPRVIKKVTCKNCHRIPARGCLCQTCWQIFFLGIAVAFILILIDIITGGAILAALGLWR